jgi:hypothetical protein
MGEKQILLPAALCIFSAAFALIFLFDMGSKPFGTFDLPAWTRWIFVGVIVVVTCVHIWRGRYDRY